MRLAVAGRSGFVGAAVAEAGRRGSITVTGLLAPRLACPTGSDPSAGAHAWIERRPSDFRRLIERLAGCDAVVNAAGLAAPGSRATSQLYGANAVWPALLACAAAEAGVPRLVHISTAAVQGRRDPLDETSAHEPFSPYSEAKAAAERVLLFDRPGGAAPPEVVVYRPTSVLGSGRAATASLVRLARSRLVPISEGLSRPVPVVLVDNVGAAALLLATARNPPAIALHPWEGLTTTSLLEVLAPGRSHVRLPERPLLAALSAVRATARAPRLAALSRKLDLLYLGQGLDARALLDLGFEPTAGLSAWQALALSP